jgi:hypothetical protein
MTFFLRISLLLLLAALPALSQAAPEKIVQSAANTARPRAVKRPKVQPVTVVLPAAALHQTLSSLLPLPVEEIDAAGRRFQGSITIDSISSLSVEQGRIVLAGQLSGRDLSMNASVGSQNIHIRLGSLALPVICEVALRFDRSRQFLLLTPMFKRTSSGRNEAEEGLMALLNNLSKEYQVPLRNLLPLSGMIGSKQVRLRMEPLDIRAENGAVTLWLRPVAAGKRR